MLTDSQKLEMVLKVMNRREREAYAGLQEAKDMLAGSPDSATYQKIHRTASSEWNSLYHLKQDIKTTLSCLD